VKPDCTILWAEDDPDDILFIEEAAQALKVSHLIVFVYNGKDVLHKLEVAEANKTLPQLIVLDYNMPIMTGAETISVLITKDHLKHIPIVLFSTGDLRKEKFNILQHAMIYKKPSDRDGFISMVREIMELCKA